jgi:hypothetical protein
MHLSLYVPADAGYVHKAAVLGVLINKIACILPSVPVLTAQLCVCMHKHIYITTIFIVYHFPALFKNLALRCRNKMTVEALFWILFYNFTIL